MSDTEEEWTDPRGDRYIECIGADGRKHICLPESDECYCGMKVHKKKLERNDWQRYSCYECTY